MFNNFKITDFNFGKKNSIINAIISTFIINLLTIAVAFYSMQIFDKVFGSSNFYTLIYITFITLFLILLIVVITKYRFYQIQIIANYYCKLLYNNINNNKNNDNYLKLTRNFLEIICFYRNNFVVLIFDALTSPIYLIVIYLIHPSLFIFSIFVAIIYYYWDIIFYSNQAKYQHELVKNSENFLKINQNLNAKNLGILQELSNFNFSDNLIKDHPKFFKNQNLNHKLLNDWQVYNKNFRLSIQILATMLSSYLVLINQITIGSIIAFSIILFRFLESISNFSNNIKNFKICKKLISENLKIHNDFLLKNNIHIDEINKILIEKISYKLLMGNDFTININSFKIEQNQILAIYAKTSFELDFIGKIITKIISPESGKIKINDFEIDLISKKNLTAHVNYFDQEMGFNFENVVQNIANRHDNFNFEDIVRFINSFGSIPEIYDIKNQFFTNIENLNYRQKSFVNLAKIFYQQLSLLWIGNHQFYKKSNWFYDKILQHNAKIKIICNPSPSFLKHCDFIAIFNNGHAEITTPKFQTKNINYEKNF